MLKSLEETGQRDNTIVVFLSDNGGTINTYSNNTPLRGFKYISGEGGVRIPMIVSWPGQLPAGQTRDELVSAMDVMPNRARTRQPGASGQSRRSQPRTQPARSALCQRPRSSVLGRRQKERHLERTPRPVETDSIGRVGSQRLSPACRQHRRARRQHQLAERPPAVRPRRRYRRNHRPRRSTPGTSERNENLVRNMA